ncbi:hypothetical protein JF116_09130 [Campylobacter fetus subsp. venerealis]|uniref:hypothetical protein n=1 Tax=Campylobacter fetus TaxID=196 RepID=UPI00190B8C93|nr:hypothetical protein [Campylobacter fetus]MBK3487542.1 hypothetical protein [Campylobacter fetus subsp. venerealis]
MRKPYIPIAKARGFTAGFGNEKSGFNNGYVKKYAQFYDLKDYGNAKKSNTKVVLEFNEYRLKDNKYIKQQGEIYD